MRVGRPSFCRSRERVERHELIVWVEGSQQMCLQPMAGIFFEADKVHSRALRVRLSHTPFITIGIPIVCGSCRASVALSQFSSNRLRIYSYYLFFNISGLTNYKCQPERLNVQVASIQPSWCVFEYSCRNFLHCIFVRSCRLFLSRRAPRRIISLAPSFTLVSITRLRDH